jgi:hypothetical protein
VKSHTAQRVVFLDVIAPGDRRRFRRYLPDRKFSADNAWNPSMAIEGDAHDVAFLPIQTEEEHETLKAVVKADRRLEGIIYLPGDKPRHN